MNTTITLDYSMLVSEAQANDFYYLTPGNSPVSGSSQILLRMGYASFFELHKTGNEDLMFSFLSQLMQEKGSYEHTGKMFPFTLDPHGQPYVNKEGQRYIKWR
jgi:hypothetical protein